MAVCFVVRFVGCLGVCIYRRCHMVCSQKCLRVARLVTDALCRSNFVILNPRAGKVLHYKLLKTIMRSGRIPSWTQNDDWLIFQSTTFVFRYQWDRYNRQPVSENFTMAFSCTLYQLIIHHSFSQDISYVDDRLAIALLIVVMRRWPWHLTLGDSALTYRLRVVSTALSAVLAVYHTAIHGSMRSTICFDTIFLAEILPSHIPSAPIPRSRNKSERVHKLPWDGKWYSSIYFGFLHYDRHWHCWF
jgi:hypothetical protein